MFNFIKKNALKNALEVIEWKDDSRTILSYPFVTQVGDSPKEIMMGAKLTVRESQAVVFINNGQIADVFGPGMYTLSTSNLPILTQLNSWPFLFKSPFKSDVYFVNTRQFTDIKWGTMNPVIMRDKEFGIIRLRAYGNFTFKIENPGIFIKEVAGASRTPIKLADFENELKTQVISSFSDLMGESKIPVLDIAQNYDELGQLLKTKVQEKFSTFGIRATDAILENISLPKEVEQTIDKRTSMGVIGNMDQFAKYQTAEAIREAANNPNGANFAGIGVGLGASGAMSTMMGQAMAPKLVACPHCGQGAPEGSKFCPHCGQSMAPVKPTCSNCHQEIVPGTKFCPHCGAKI